jgi:hypothetical protein
VPYDWNDEAKIKSNRKQPYVETRPLSLIDVNVSTSNETSPLHINYNYASMTVSKKSVIGAHDLIDHCGIHHPYSVLGICIAWMDDSYALKGVQMRGSPRKGPANFTKVSPNYQCLEVPAIRACTLSLTVIRRRPTGVTTTGATTLPGRGSSISILKRRITSTVLRTT